MDGEIDIRRYLRLFWRRKWIILGSLACLMAVTFFLTQRMPKIYQASSKVLIKQPPSVVRGTRIIEEITSIDTYLEIIKSRDMMEFVVAKLNENKEKLPLLSVSDPASDVRSRTIINTIRAANIIIITVKYLSPEGAMILSNTISTCFSEQSANLAKAKIKEKKSFIEAQLPLSRGRLEECERALEKFKRKHHLLSETGGALIQNQIAELENERNTIIIEIRMKEEALKNLEKELERQNEALFTSLTSIQNVSINTLRDELLKLNQERMLYIQAGLTTDHPTIIEITDRIERTREEIEKRLIDREGNELLMLDPLDMVKDISQRIIHTRLGLLDIRAKLSATDELLKEYRERLEKYPEKEYELAALQRSYQFNEGVYTMILQRYEEVKLAEVSEVGSVMVIEKARLPKGPVSPDMNRNILFAFIFGLGLGVAAAVFVEYLDTSIKETSDIERWFSMPVIGVVPTYGGGITYDDIKEQSIGEVYKRIRTNLKFLRSGDESPRTLMITSSTQGEGKTTVVANLAVALARGKKRVLLIESDLRKPALHRLFEVDRKPGLVEYLVDDAASDEIIRGSNIENLSILPAGATPISPPELLDSNRMRELVIKMASDFDIVLFDSPPVLPCTDALILGSMLDGVILVVQIKGPRRELIASAQSALVGVGAKILGTILNRGSKEDYYGLYHYYYGYR
ncbi:polysaccharide biosynthesis tyrosine autokinase [candidate division WOR-3 bacterium]|nr:polysaccharide biosynthesis tyrosine autokinase [candidate division WOR-3 bacterium]